MEYNKTTHFYSDGDADHDLFMYFSRVRYLAYRVRERELQRYGITPEQVGILFVVRASDGKLAPADIARMFLLQRHTISSMVERMEKKGLIKKNQDTNNKNRIRLSITEKGEENYQLSTRRGPIHRIMSSLEDKERSVFIRCLQKISSAAAKEQGIDENGLPCKTKRKNKP
jgi:MarR family transcriptional regulator, organic hydroperoxide resistance regulator